MNSSQQWETGEDFLIEGRTLCQQTHEVLSAHGAYPSVEIPGDRANFASVAACVKQAQKALFKARREFGKRWGRPEFKGGRTAEETLNRVNDWIEHHKLHLYPENFS